MTYIFILLKIELIHGIMIQGEKMDKKLTSNYIYSVIYQTLIVITPFITVPYLTRVMGVEALSIMI